jgi:hypothetical protein
MLVEELVVMVDTDRVRIVLHPLRVEEQEILEVLRFVQETEPLPLDNLVVLVDEEDISERMEVLDLDMVLEMEEVQERLFTDRAETVILSMVQVQILSKEDTNL